VIERESFVYYGPEQWHSLWRNRHQLLSRLARANKVVYVEPRPYIEEVLAELRRRECSAAQLIAARRVEPERSNLWVYRSPHFAPLGGPGPVRAASHALRRAALRHDLAALGIDRPIVWISTPTQHDARLDLPARLRVYHIVDDYLAYFDLPESHRAGFARRERELIDWADLVIAVSPELMASKGAGNPKFRLLPNGFDAAAYVHAQPPAIPPALAGLPRPILGYVGLISVRLDLERLDGLAGAHPEWTLALLGSVAASGCEDALAGLKARPNVRFLPPVPGEQVAAYVRSFDLGLVPYRVTQETTHASPLKVYEYLAAGLPVVAADVPGARQFAGLVSIAETAADWEAAIHAALASDDAARRAARRAAVAPHTWDARVETLSGFLLAALA
jgi:glycosyltransferase involved in cell wall biosynthesis